MQLKNGFAPGTKSRVSRILFFNAFFLTLTFSKLIPPRGCAYVEFYDRKTASKCLDKMKEGYRLDGVYVKVTFRFVVFEKKG